MAKTPRKKAVSRSKLPQKPEPHKQSGDPLGGLRQEIDRLDRELVAVMNRLAECAREIGHIKQSHNQQTYDPSREEMVLGRVAEANAGPLSDESVKAVFREIISGSRAIEQHLRVAYLGPA